MTEAYLFFRFDALKNQETERVLHEEQKGTKSYSVIVGEITMTSLVFIKDARPTIAPLVWSIVAKCPLQGNNKVLTYCEWACARLFLHFFFLYDIVLMFAA